ncbi:PAS domain S-box protein [bacterium]|nr:PAS domain S-box protein [bacterium]
MTEKPAAEDLRIRILELESELKILREKHNSIQASSIFRTPEIKQIEENLLDSLTSGFTILDENCKILFINKTAEKLFGISKREIIGQNISKLIVKVEGQPDFEKSLRKAFWGDLPIFGKSRIKLFNDNELYLDLSFTININPINESRQLIIQQREFSDDQIAVEELQRCKDQLNSPIGNDPDIILNVDHDGTILFINHTSKNLNPEEAIGKPIYNYALPKDHQMIRDQIRTTFQTGKEGCYESAGIGSDGIVRWYSTRIIPIKHDDEVIAVTLGLHDNSEKKEAEEELKKSQTLLNTVFDSIPGTVMVLDRKMNIIASNWRGMEKLEAINPDENVKCHELYWQRDEPCVDCHLKKVFETGKPLTTELFNKCNNAHKQIRAYPVLNDLGIVRYVIKHVEDITLHKENEEKLKVAIQKGQAAQRIKADFLSKIGHELKTPMIGILGFAKLGMERYKKNNKEKLKSYFSTIYESALKLQVLLNNLLDLSQLEVKNMGYDFQTEKLSMVTTIILNDMFVMLKDNNIKLKYNKPDFSDHVKMDVDQIGKVIKNLMLNAIKYSKSGSQIKVEILEEDKYVQFAISDSGNGIPENELDMIFKKFKQGSENEKNSGGTGLGLAISKKIITDHKGVIWAENNTKGGSTFKFLLPKESEVETL